MNPFRNRAGVFKVTHFPHDYYIVTVTQARIKGLFVGLQPHQLGPYFKIVQ